MMSPLDIICINTSGGTRTHTCDILSVVPLPIGLRSQKRKVWDSNPQGAFTPNGFQDRLLIRPVTFQTVPPRLELGQAVPKTAVLPLHHGTSVISIPRQERNQMFADSHPQSASQKSIDTSCWSHDRFHSSPDSLTSDDHHHDRGGN